MYVDASNISMNGGHGMRYEVLRALACRNSGEAQRLNAYVAFDQRRSMLSPEYGTKSRGFQAALRDQGFRVTVKNVKHFTDEDGNAVSKSNADLDMAVDALTESERLDTVLLATGDGDFVQVVRALQSKGCRVEVLGFDNVSRELRDSADQFINGYLIAGLLPTQDQANPRACWGEVGSRVRGLCNRFSPEEGYGFIGFWPVIPDSSVLTASETKAAYFRSAALTDTMSITKLPARNLVLEFDLVEPAKPGGALEAKRIEIVSGT
ncbi:NYN domain-containing protein [Ralstonia pseudosolanacearum]|uniref:LabA-like NYN domain-containing protein n=1 Tax=Ralstonia pseudosolanacearum TaxID=1310165 RepID=UPI0018D09110|nr:NYN domain-containing protein [Ralstonia pseudosolanacearum]UWD89579.1 NYN domain-containing protein [Ralstonia pseudosolanacearum]